ncbi:hypothetical protein BpHYR1_027733 [Brachionus plicatilis]|uniref:Uncharacterized protein n=1 Tax=Brachionus plicatilis TaxID=10195 RepID=A0A3M7SL02_BRAPC|nr:hypothetical protein BpHYR1_027733 [Brachionus plicatilis]
MLESIKLLSVLLNQDYVHKLIIKLNSLRNDSQIYLELFKLAKNIHTYQISSVLKVFEIEQ